MMAGAQEALIRAMAKQWQEPLYLHPQNATMREQVKTLLETVKQQGWSDQAFLESNHLRVAYKHSFQDELHAVNSRFSNAECLDNFNVELKEFAIEYADKFDKLDEIIQRNAVAFEAVDSVAAVPAEPGPGADIVLFPANTGRG